MPLLPSFEMMITVDEERGDSGRASRKLYFFFPRLLFLFSLEESRRQQELDRSHYRVVGVVMLEGYIDAKLLLKLSSLCTTLN